MFKNLVLFAMLAMSSVVVADYNPASLPDKSDAKGGQFGWNNCVARYGASSQKSRCQNVFVNSVKDFCLWGPAFPNSVIGDVEPSVISWCMKSGYGTRLIPNGAIKGAHFVKTPDFVQVTGHGDLTKLNIKFGDQGGELDPHGASGSGNPVGGLVFTRAYTGQYQEIKEWHNFISYNEYCIRACIGPNAKKACPHIYDVMGCYWNDPADYRNGIFDQCEGDTGKFPGIYGTSTFYQGQKKTPGPHPAPAKSNCRSYPSISNGPAAFPPKKRDASKGMQTAVARAVNFDDDE